MTSKRINLITTLLCFPHDLLKNLARHSAGWMIAAKISLLIARFIAELNCIITITIECLAVDTKCAYK
jgi:hypothetical protein